MPLIAGPDPTRNCAQGSPDLAHIRRVGILFWIMPRPIFENPTVGCGGKVERWSTAKAGEAWIGGSSVRKRRTNPNGSGHKLFGLDEMTLIHKFLLVPNEPISRSSRTESFGAGQRRKLAPVRTLFARDLAAQTGPREDGAAEGHVDRTGIADKPDRKDSRKIDGSLRSRRHLRNRWQGGNYQQPIERRMRISNAGKSPNEGHRPKVGFWRSFCLDTW